MERENIPAEIHPSRYGKDVGGVVKFLDQSSRLDKELLTIGATIEEAIGRAVIKDDNQRNKIIRYYGRLMDCHLLPQLDRLRIWINASFAVGGHQRDEALMANAKLWVPEGGRRMDKKQMAQFLNNQSAQRAERQASNKNNGGSQEKE